MTPRSRAAAAVPTQEWLLLIHRIPAKPLYLRARLRAGLGRLGAKPLKNSVYALPRREGALDRLREIAAEIRRHGGEAFVCEARFAAAEDEAALLAAFREQARVDYERVAAETAALGRRFETGRIPSHRLSAGLARLDRELARVRSVDFFGSEGESQAAARLLDLKDRASASTRKPRAASPWVGRTWVTRRGIMVDRIACAWFVRRFLDPAATIRFVSMPHALRSGEVGFDMPGGEFSHEGGGCSFETLMAKTGVHDPALSRIARIVHALDLRDGKFDPPEAAGLEPLLNGMIAAHPDDASRLERGTALFDDLYRSWSRPGIVPPILARKSVKREREGRP